MHVGTQFYAGDEAHKRGIHPGLECQKSPEVKNWDINGPILSTYELYNFFVFLQNNSGR